MIASSILSLSTMSALVLGLGGAVHVAWISGKKGWYVIAAGIALILMRRVFEFSDPLDAVNSLHSVIMLTGIAMIFRSYKMEVASLKSLADSVPNMVWMADESGELTYINQRFEEYTGCNLAEVNAFRKSDLIHPGDRDRVAKLWDGCVKHGLSFESEHRMRSALGEYQWFLCRALPLRSKGLKIQWCGIALNVNEAHRAVELLKGK